MENKISAITEASDKYFHQTRVAVYSFIKHNPWFDGTLYLLTISALPISQKNLDSLSRIYENLQIINLSSLSQVSNIETEFKKKNRDLDLFYRYLRLFVLQINVPNLLYFSSSSLFLGQASEIISQKNLYSTNTELSLFYVSDFKYRFDEIIESQIIKSEPIEKIFEQHALNYFYPFKDDCYNIASQFNDSLFNKKKNQLSSLKYLNYNTFYSKFLNCSNINRVWLQENHELQKFLSSPSSVKFTYKKENIITPIFNLKATIDSISNNILEKNNEPTIEVVDLSILSNYLNNKKIAIVANSSDLLNYSYGNLIDSHDIVIRFNGYVISDNHTGKRTDIHCIFREAQFNLNNNSNYLIVFSKPVYPWKNAVSELNIKYPHKKIINYNFPTDSNIFSKFGKNIILTSGLCSILLIEELGLEKYTLNLFGFNGYAGGVSSILRSNDSTAISTVHNYSAEMNYLNLQFKEVSPSILQKIKQ